MKIAILDDYQNVAKRFADWSEIESRVELTVFTDHLTDQKALDHVLAAPHIDDVTEATYKVFYGDTVKAIGEWLDRQN